ncbi:MAG TPA: TIGR03118 family protein, partial [Saprospiraceae bacterium]|nr:TIGR03118 family protein [Saprospiraceae bacterium]
FSTGSPPADSIQINFKPQTMGNTSKREVRPDVSNSRLPRFTWQSLLFISALFITLFQGCAKDGNTDDLLLSPTAKLGGGTSGTGTGTGGSLIKNAFLQTNLVADVADYHPNIIDPYLINAWGVALGPTGAFWISSADRELSVIYDDSGQPLRKPVTMEGDPTGQVYNNTAGFVIPGGGPAKFIFATEYGTITAWESGDVATTIIDSTAFGASYTGLEIASDGQNTYLFVANLGQGRIDVFDQNWAYVTTKPFIDVTLPVGAKPFNVRQIDGSMYVTYEAPAGSAINVFDMNGNFMRRFAEGPYLRSPWGITKTPMGFGLGGAFLVGNFGDGRINIITPTGGYKGSLVGNDGRPIVIDGLWALIFEDDAFTGAGDPDLYFTAGPAGETHGLFGEISPAH